MTGGAQNRGVVGPLVSVIVPTYNYAAFIGEALESVRAQTYSNWECVVVDDGSTDGTREIVERWAAQDARFRYVRQERRRQAVAKNRGIAESRGEYLQFLDADDLIESRKLEEHARALEVRRDAHVVYGGARYFRTDPSRERRYSMREEDAPWMPEVSGSGRGLLLELVRHNIMPINSALLRRSAVEEVGGFDEDLPLAEDWYYWLRCAARGHLFLFDDAPGTLALVRSHPASSSKNRRDFMEHVVRMRRKVGSLVKDAEARRLNRELMAEAEAMLGIAEVTEGNLARGVRRLLSASAKRGKPRWRFKYLLCALAAPFVPRERFGEFSTNSLTRPVKGQR